MSIETARASVDPDSAAVFAMALSLWEVCEKERRETNFNISECYNGVDQFMREVMRIANQFEDWSCQHVDFDEFSEVWPYYLGDNFGTKCLSVLPMNCLMEFGEQDCLRVALSLRLPVVAGGELPVPIDLTAVNPIIGSAFQKFRIQTVRDSIEGNDATAYVAGDDPFDEDFSSSYFSLYGIEATGLLEHIADRSNYEEVLKLAHKLAPGIAFPISPTFTIKGED
jgi:hypothetical protein